MVEDKGFHDIIEENHYIEEILPQGVLRKLNEEEMQYYRMPFPTPASRKPILQYIHDLPVNQLITPVHDLIESYSNKLQQSHIPKLMLYALPGFNTPIETVMWARKHLPDITIVEIVNALHYATESEPFKVADAISKWYDSL